MLQLEAFRRQKAEKKQPSKHVPSGEASSTPATLGRPSGSGLETVGLSEQQSAAPSSSGTLFSEGNVDAPPPASEGVPGPSLAQNGRITDGTGSHPQQPPASAPVEAMPAQSEAPASKQRTARSLFSAGLPALPPLPLPPTPNSRSVSLVMLQRSLCYSRLSCCFRSRISSPASGWIVMQLHVRKYKHKRWHTFAASPISDLKPRIQNQTGSTRSTADSDLWMIARTLKITQHILE